MSKSEEMLNSIKEVLENVTGIGQVRLFPQRTITEEEFEATFQTSLNGKKPVNAWIIRLDASSNSRSGNTLSSYWRNHTIAITGFLSFNNRSDFEMMDIAEAILDAFGTKMTLGLSDVPVPGAPVLFESSMSLTGIDHAMLGPVLCTTATFQVTATEWKGIVTFT